MRPMLHVGRTKRQTRNKEDALRMMMRLVIQLICTRGGGQTRLTKMGPGSPGWHPRSPGWDPARILELQYLKIGLIKKPWPFSETLEQGISNGMSFFLLRVISIAARDIENDCFNLKTFMVP